MVESSRKPGSFDKEKAKKLQKHLEDGFSIQQAI